ncbi:MAG: hypothetical protein NZ765_10025, partial [Anaerolineae bacterium]|nr:hypothetical protein [Anaerolineae bacterium]
SDDVLTVDTEQGIFRERILPLVYLGRPALRRLPSQHCGLQRAPAARVAIPAVCRDRWRG